PEGESWHQNPSGDYVKNTVGGEGDAQWSTLFKILQDAGYGGTVSLEVTDPADIKGSVIQGVANLKRILAEVKNS
ncbi:MAG: hypothetical protein O2954_18380, partial [bacterium]|nr:hypothetical protein [bacterium]